MSEKRKLLTAIVPCYNEEEALPFFYAEISRVAAEMQAVDFEFLFINDGSKDGTLRILRKRSTRKGEPVIRSFFARCFYKIINKISKTQMVSGARDYVLMKRRVMESILALPEYNRFTKGIYNWVGYNTKWISYENVQRVAGTTKWSFWKLFKYSLECIVAFSTAPLSIASFFGFLFCLISIIGIIVVIVRQFAGVASVAGWPSLVCVILFVSGIQLFCMGILGMYLSKTYLETKKRPMYFASETDEDVRRNIKEQY